MIFELGIFQLLGIYQSGVQLKHALNRIVCVFFWFDLLLSGVQCKYIHFVLFIIEFSVVMHWITIVRTNCQNHDYTFVLQNWALDIQMNMASYTHRFSSNKIQIQSKQEQEY